MIAMLWMFFYRLLLAKCFGWRVLKWLWQVPDKDVGGIH